MEKKKRGAREKKKKKREKRSELHYEEKAGEECMPREQDSITRPAVSE